MLDWIINNNFSPTTYTVGIGKLSCHQITINNDQLLMLITDTINPKPAVIISVPIAAMNYSYSTTPNPEPKLDFA